MSGRLPGVDPARVPGHSFAVRRPRFFADGVDGLMRLARCLLAGVALSCLVAAIAPVTVFAAPTPVEAAVPERARVPLATIEFSALAEVPEAPAADPSTTDRVWTTVAGWAGVAARIAAELAEGAVIWIDETVTWAADQAGPALASVRSNAEEAIAATGHAATPLLDDAGQIAGQARVVVVDAAESLHARTAELRNHPVVEAAADIGIFLRVAEVLGLGALIGGLAWARIRGA